MPQRFESVEDGHVNVEEHNIERLGGETLQGLPTVLGFADDIALRFQKQTADTPVERLIVNQEPGLLVSRTVSVVRGVRLTFRSRPATFWLKSEGPATSTPFTSIVAEETRFEPSASPFVTCRR